MRRRREQAAKLKVKILEDRKAGLTYEEIQRKRGASSRTIADLVKGNDPKKYCQKCGETDPEKLQEHHPDKVNDSTRTTTLCASCHSKVTREQQRKRTNDAKNEPVTAKTTSPVSIPTLQRIITRPQAPSAQSRPLTPSEKRWAGRGFCYGAGGVAFCEGIFDRKLPGWLRVVLAVGGGILAYAGSRIE